MRKLRIGVVMDPVENINIDKDTTFVLMLEAQRRGHELYFMEVDDLFVRGGATHGRYRRLQLARATPHTQLGEFATGSLADFDSGVDAQRPALRHEIFLRHSSAQFDRPEQMFSHEQSQGAARGQRKTLCHALSGTDSRRRW